MTKKELPEELKTDGKKLSSNVIPIDNDFERTSDGNVKQNSPKNVKKIILHDFPNVFAYNNFTQSLAVVKNIDSMMITKGSYRDIYTDIMMDAIESKYHIPFKTDVFMRGLRQAALKLHFNPVLDRINAVEWDGKERVETFFIDFLGAKNNDYVREVTRKWLVGAVARALKPGIKFELMPVLIGSQGIGKSTLCNSLCPEYFLDNLPSLSGINKDNLMLIKDNWIVEVAELSAMSKTAIEGTKAFISTRVDKYKAPYASTVEDHARRCVFIGTTNETEFLKDKTGNRRFLPIECGINETTKDVFKLKEDYILQVLAEAKHYFDNGEKLFLSEETKETLEEVQESNVVEDPLEEEINDYLDMHVPFNWDEYTTFHKRNYFVKYYGNTEPTDRNANKIDITDMDKVSKITTKEIIQAVLNISGRDVMSASRGNYGKKINLIMNGNKQFHKSENIVINGKRARGWKRNEE